MPNRNNTKTKCAQLTNAQIETIEQEFMTDKDGKPLDDPPTWGSVLQFIIADYFAARDIYYPEGNPYGSSDYRKR